MTGGVRVRGGVRVSAGGAGQPVLLLLHGLGATGDVWNGWHGLLAARWPGRWLAPDLPGHGGSAPLDRYSFESLAAGVAGVLDPEDRVVVLGHSLGGVVGLALAGGGFGGSVEAVVGLGVKVAWTPDELARVGSLAYRPVARFTSRAEAVARYLRVSGLANLLGDDDSRVDAGVRAEQGHWRLAMDPGAFAVGAPDMPSLLAAVPASVVLARGEHDPMVTGADLARLGVPAITLAGLGHNAHVDAPDQLAALIRALY